MEEIIEVKRVSKKYHVYEDKPITIKESVIKYLKGARDKGKIIWALKDISFTVDRGSVVGIIGHNGAGKSTLLRLISGLGKPTTGIIRHSGRLSALLELGTGFHLDLTGRENIMTGGLLNGFSPKQVKQMENEIIEFAELDGFIDLPLRTYSSGMFLRLAFSTAMCFDPEILVVDEVLAVGDSNFKMKCYEKLEDFRLNQKTMVLVSHNLYEIERLCDQVVVLEDGQLVLIDEPINALNAYHEIMRLRTEKKVLAMTSNNDNLQIHKHGSKLGTKEVEIIDVTFLNSSNEIIKSVMCGDSLKIKIEYINKNKLKDFALIISIYNDLDIHCYEQQISSVSSTIGQIANNGSLICAISQINLLEGRYYINIGAYPLDWNYTFDFHNKMYFLDVLLNKDSGIYTTGIALLDVNWYKENTQIS